MHGGGIDVGVAIEIVLLRLSGVGLPRTGIFPGGNVADASVTCWSSMMARQKRRGCVSTVWLGL
jgi:hypothetical protein